VEELSTPPNEPLITITGMDISTDLVKLKKKKKLFGTGLSLDEIASPPGVGSSEELSPNQAILKKFKNARHLTSSEKEVYKEIRRQSHISAEQKRRGSIKVGKVARSYLWREMLEMFT